MASEILNAVTIYEADGVKYTGTRKLYIKAHPRFLGFVRLCIDDREYSLGVDDLVRAIDRTMTQTPAPVDDALDVQTA